MNDRCFAVTGPFVPANEPMTLLSYKYLRALDMNVDVIALELKSDESLRQKLAKDPKYHNFDVQYVGKYNDALFSINNVNLFKSLHYMRKYINDAISVYKGQRVIYTSSFPAYVHRVGLELKKQNSKAPGGNFG